MNPTREEALFAAALLAAYEATANPLHTAAGNAPTIKLDLAAEALSEANARKP